MSLKDILQIEKERVQRERVVLVTIYDRMKNRINNSVKVKSKECIYTIPEFIPGYPLIDIVKTMNYLLTKLKKEGFIAIQLTPLDLYITWDPVKIRQLNENIQSLDVDKQLYSKKTNKPFWNPREDIVNKSSQKLLAEKEFERVNEDFVNSLIISKKSKQ